MFRNWTLGFGKLENEMVARAKVQLEMKKALWSSIESTAVAKDNVRLGVERWF